MASASLDVHTAHSIAEIKPAEWDALNCPFSSYRWHQYGEAIYKDSTPLYVMLSRHGEPVARASFWLTRDEPLPLPPNMARTVVEAALRRWPLLLCRAPMASASCLSLPEDPTLREAALKIVAEVAEAYSRQQGVSFLIFDYLQPSAVQIPGYISLDMPDAGTALSIAWTSFDDYVKQLGKSARKDFNRHRNRAADLGIQIKTHPQVNRLDEAVALIQNVERHHQTPLNPRTRAALENAHLVDLTWITAEFDGRLVGCGALLGDGDTRALTFLGMDYDVQYVYFQLMYAAIQSAIESGVRVLWGGTAAYEFKERLGFERMANNQIVFTASNRMVGRALRYLVAS